MKHEERLRAFLSKTVNLNRSRLDDLDRRVTAIMNCLRKDPAFGPRSPAVRSPGSVNDDQVRARW